MLLSCLVHPNARSMCQVPAAWSRLFHIRRTLCSTFKPGTDLPKSESHSLDEQRKDTGRLTKSRTVDGKSRYGSRDRGKSLSDNKEERIQYDKKVRYKTNYSVGSGRGIPDVDGEMKSFTAPVYKRRVFTEKELKEEKEFEEFRPELNSADRFGEGVSYPLDKSLETTKATKKVLQPDQHEQHWARDKPRRQQKIPAQRTNLPRDWSESFGTLNVKSGPTVEDALFSENPAERTAGAVDEEFDDSDDEDISVKRHIPLLRKNRRHIPYWYARKMQKFGKRGMVKWAIEVFDKWMIERDRVKPTHYEYGILITLLGRAGYLHKAFNLFYQMQQMNLVPAAKVFTSLFNACAKSPFKDQGLVRANKLHTLMIEKGIEPTLITYQAMINAFGICGDTEMAFSLVDEVLQKYKPNLNLLSSSLVACISDKEAGFRHAIQVWRKFLKLGLKPDVRCYNLLLRAVKECGVGPQTMDNNLLLIEAAGGAEASLPSKRTSQKKVVSSLQWTVDPKQLSSGSVVEVIEGIEPGKNPKFLANQIYENGINSKATLKKRSVKRAGDVLVEESATSGLDKSEMNGDRHWWENFDTLTNTKSLVETDFSKQSVDLLHLKPEEMPDLLNPFDKSLQIVSLGRIKRAKDKLALIGGMKRVLANMEKDGARPDIITFTQLMSTVPVAEEDEVLYMMELYEVEPDTDFFNHLICKKVEQSRSKDALEVRKMIEARNLVPNIRTYGCLAKACVAKADGIKLLEDIEKANMCPNTTIMLCLMSASHFNFSYKIHLMLQMKKLDMKASANLIRVIEKQISAVKEISVEKERKAASSGSLEKDKFQEDFKRFLGFYERWIEEIPLEKEEHPWSEFWLDEDDKLKSLKS